ncbi:type II and III secretion system protein family protein [Amaricoccus tamworthensis]|uniref:type II and III secretion system protein family protein n=1 Tax=Amaricoccus tamworthensis TaxID=57002 RepID=UPI003C7C5784
MKKLLVGLTVLVSVLVMNPLMFRAPATAFELVKPAVERDVSIVVGTGQLIRVEEEFSSLFVANPEVADIEVKSPRLLYLTGVGVGETTLFAVDADDNILMSAVIRVTHNVGALQRGIARIAPNRNISATTVDQSLVISGTVDSPDQAADIIQVAKHFVDSDFQVVNHLAVDSPTQVNLQVRIAEVNRNVDRQLGINWSAVHVSAGGSTIGFSGGTVPPNGYSGGFSRTTNSFSIDVLLRALSEEGLVSILAEPNLTARSGEAASFLAGGEYPYSVRTDDGYSIEFKDYGIGLAFTPTVLSDKRISLKVSTAVSDLNYGDNSSIPTLDTRRAETSVDLASGQSFAIAGLIQNGTSQDESRVPGLGSLPILGALFKSSGFQREQTELVIIVTPVIVEPTDPGEIRTPVDNYVPPNDFERILLGRFQGNAAGTDAVRNRMNDRRLYGSSGFVFE